MKIAMGVGGEVTGTPMSPQDIVADVAQAEADGFGSAWTVHFSRGVDALNVLAVAGTRTSRIDLGVGIVPTYPRHPLALAQQAATTQAFCGGRLTLGVGVSHRPVIEGLHGLGYDRPAGHMRDYLSVLVPLLRAGSVQHRGEFYQVDGGFVVPGTSPVQVLVGALSPLMVQVAGELADGVVTWLAGPRTLGEQIVPRLHAAAAAGSTAVGSTAAGSTAAGPAAAGPAAAGSAAAGSAAAGSAAAGSAAAGSAAAGSGAGAGGVSGAGPRAPRVVAALPMAVCSDVGLARRTADEVFARYTGFDNYRRLLEREGMPSPGYLAITGAEPEIEKQLSRLADLGVTELWPIIFPVGPDPAASRHQTRTLLTHLATHPTP